MELIVLNQSNFDRIIRVVVAIILLILYFTLDLGSMLEMASLFAAAALLFNAVSGNCYIYRILGYSSCPLPDTE